MSEAAYHLLALSWKNSVIRKRRIINSVIEAAAPILIYVVLALSRNTIAELEDMSRELEEPPLRRIIYTPYTPMTRELMKDVGNVLNLSEVNVFDIDHKTVGYWTAPKMYISEFTRKMTNDEAILLFHLPEDVLDNSGRRSLELGPGEELEFDEHPPPENNFTLTDIKNLFQSNNNFTRRNYDIHDVKFTRSLNYTIRMKKDFFDKSQRKNFGKIYKNFMKLQWAVDQAYLKKRNGRPMLKNVSLHQLPMQREHCIDQSKILIGIFIRLANMFSLVLPYLFIAGRMVSERISGIQELLKMEGVSTCTLNASHFLNSSTFLVIYATALSVIFQTFSSPVLMHTNGALIFFAQAFFYLSIMSFAFIASYIPKSTNHSDTILSILFFVVLFGQIAIANQTLPKPIRVLTGLIPFIAIDWFWEEVIYKEIHCKGLKFSDLTRKYLIMPSGVALLMMLVQSLLFFSLAWYLDKVVVGPYGVSKPWNFLFKKEYWRKVKYECIEEPLKRPLSKQYFEPPAKELEPGIQVVNISKIYKTRKGGTFTALSHLTLTIYKGEITVLVGHNGAGKTTLMSIITGMTDATDGKVYVNGMDVKQYGSIVRRHLGLCPQSNLSFPYLTVKEHIIFFSMLKGKEYKQSVEPANVLIVKLKLEGKENSQSNELSGGMKRRLQLACALAGGATVLILDEPTSGLDVETRRELWDMLLDFRGERTVLLTTHFMEEADALGDRVAALHEGKLRCNATPMYLKSSIGTGYRLTVTVKKGASVSDITRIVTDTIPESVLTDQTSNTLTYKLPAKKSKEFAAMFNELEERRDELGIETLGVGVATLDEVFLKLCSDVSLADVEVENASRSNLNKVNGFPRIRNIFKALLKRQFKATYSSKWVFLLLQVALPIVLFMAVTSNSNEKSTHGQEARRILNLDIYNHSDGDKKVYLQLPTSYLRTNSMLKTMPNINFVFTKNITKDILNMAKNTDENNKFIIGIDQTKQVPSVHYSVDEMHAAPVALNLLSNIYASTYEPWSTDMPINTYNHPIIKRSSTVQVKSNEMAQVWTLVIYIIILYTMSAEIVLPCKEREAGSRHFQIMSGCPPPLYWAVTLLYDLITPTFIYIPSIVISLVIFEEDNTTNRADFLVAMYVLLMFSIIAFLCFIYTISMFLNRNNASLFVIINILILGVVVGPTIFELIENGDQSIVLTIIQIPGHLFPPFTISFGFMQITQVALLNAYCDANRHLCPDVIPIKNFNVQLCCESSSAPYDYLAINGAGLHLIILVLQILFYSALTILTEYGITQNAISKALNLNYKPPPKKFHNELVDAETEYCKDNIDKPPPENDVITYDLHKKRFDTKKPIYAVRGVSFTVKKGECFGLLGINGAGKSTTFQMLVADTPMTRGEIYAGGYYLKKDWAKYLYSFGYCPQFGGVDEFLTGDENLELLLIIRGVETKDVNDEVKTWIEIVGLAHVSNRPVSTYSGGCNRRLVAAAALCSDASVSLLDEPTAGVDTAARRKVWAALKRALAHDRSIIITSHSMDEMEALCHRIAIMNEGEICTMGSPAMLRAKHACGYALRLKLKTINERDDYTATQYGDSMAAMKQKLHSQFQDVKLKDSHATMLLYHILDKVRYSDLFQFLEKLKESHSDVIEDYSVTETTLEEVFLSFAKKNKDGTNSVLQLRDANKQRR